MKNKVLQTIRKHDLLQRSMHIVVGLSGGPDSMCLFDVLHRLSDEMQWQLYAVHVNHMLRPGEAQEDQKYVEEICEKAGVPCYVFTKDCNRIAAEESMTSEEAGRKVRYEAFSEVAMKLHKEGCGVPKEKIAIAVAHNANDQCETILFRMLRGSGTDGLAGIAYKRYDDNGIAIVRPVLDLKREEIEGYCRERNLFPRIDNTNSENRYTRNRIRNMLIPYIEENFNENIVDTINRLGKIASEDRDFLRREAEKEYERAFCQSKQALSCKYLRKLHKAVRLRIYTLALGNIGLTQNMTFAQSEGIDALIFSQSPSAMCSLTQGFCARREYDKLILYKKAPGYEEIAEPGWHLIEMTESRFEEYCAEAGREGKIYGAFSGVTPGELELRTRRSGDRIKLGGGTKKLQDFFSDEKVPKVCRDKILLLAMGNDILWVLPSEHFAREAMRQKGRFSLNFKAQPHSGDAIIVLEKL